jgi:hypothetical protein
MRNKKTNLYLLGQADLWGGCGDVLISGYAYHKTEDHPLLLHRAGPFLPPISFPWCISTCKIIVSDTFRKTLESKGLPGITIKRAIKHRIIKLHWHKWDRSKEEPKKYTSNEPEDYIWGKRHDPNTAKQMEVPWELCLPIIQCKIRWLQPSKLGKPNRYHIRLKKRENCGMFLSSEYGRAIVDEATKKWLEEQVGEWVSFVELERA